MSKRTYSGAVFLPGARVEIHPSTDLWMRGARYGDVIKTTKGGAIVHVKLDNLAKPVRAHASMWRPV